MDFDQSMVLDATRGSIARFINHSCAPNCHMIKWTVSGKPRMALFAGDEGIMTGEELTYNYNFDPFSAKNVQECRCGAENCHGVLGPKPKDFKDALKPIITGTKRKLHQAMDGVKETVAKRTKLVPTSMKVAFDSAKEQASRRMSHASILGSSSGSKNSMTRPKPTSQPKTLKRKSTTALLDDQDTQQPKKPEARRRSTGMPVRRGWKGWVEVDVAPESPEDEPPKEEGGSKWQPIPAANAESNVVRTVRRSNRGTPGKSIAVVSIGGDEMKDWR